VFDLGGVVVEWRPDVLVAGVFDDAESRRRALADFIGHPDWLELDRGTLDPDLAIDRAASRTGLAREEIANVLARVPASLVPKPETVALMERLKAGGHRLYCLSNMHVASIEYLEASHGFFDLFDGTAVSCRLKLCKPEPAIYQRLLTSFDLRAEDTVFIDDVEANVAAARQAGIRGIRFESAAQVERELLAMRA
jgi:HAD superfamily hydrolase (TIGR01509 family)